jgi:hypothetical protein
VPDDCPPGDWFCEPAPAPGSEPLPAFPEASAPLSPPPSDDAEQEMRIDVERVQAAPSERDSEWGVNLHATLGLMGDAPERSGDAGMNGLGGALRYCVLPWLAIEGSVEVVWGTDYRGFDRLETALLGNALFIANAGSPVQLYGVAGVGLATASVAGSYLSGTLDRDSIDERYGYFGGQLGVGLEARISRHFALGGDVLAFIRTRTDSDASDKPEYVDLGTGRTTNTSGGGLVRLGATFYW